MKNKSIEIVFAPSGELKIEAVGFRGADCERATRFLEQALGRNTGRRWKSDYYRRVQAQQRVGL